MKKEEINTWNILQSMLHTDPYPVNPVIKDRYAHVLYRISTLFILWEIIRTQVSSGRLFLSIWVACCLGTEVMHILQGWINILK
jgi:hypothetical protein